MNRLRSFAAFWWDFVVGDDAWLAVGIVVALIATAVVQRIGIPAWWVLPAATMALLSWSVTRAATSEPIAPRTVDDDSLASDTDSASGTGA